MFYSFLVYIPLSGKNIVKWSIRHFARHHTWVTIVLTCLEQSEKRGGPRRTMYVVTFISHVRDAVKQLIGQYSRFVQIRELEELEVTSEVTKKVPVRTKIKGSKPSAKSNVSCSCSSFESYLISVQKNILPIM